METSVMEDTRDIRILPDPESLAEAAAKIFTEAAAVAIAARRVFSVALSGGSTPRLLFHILSSEYRNTINWEQVHLFWSDERTVPPDHEQSNFRIAYEELISGVPIPPANVHRIKGELGPAEAAGEYEGELRRYFGDNGMPAFDLILLGVGKDGHTASLFPDAAILKEEVRHAVPSYSETMGNWRVTLTLPVLNNAWNILFLVAGKSKAGIIDEILGRGKSHLYPAGLVKPAHGRNIWLLDREAASEAACGPDR